MDISVTANDLSTRLDDEVLRSVYEILGQKVADDIKESARRFEADKANGDLYGRLMFSHGVIWACNKIKMQQFKRDMELRRGMVTLPEQECCIDMTNKEGPVSFICEDEREAVREIYRGITYRYYKDDISIQFKGIAYVNAIDEYGNLVVLRLKGGVICGVSRT